MQLLPLVLALICADPKPATTRPANPGPHTQPADTMPTFGAGLDSSSAAAGRLALFDGETATGWRQATVRNGLISAGRTTTQWRGKLRIYSDAAKPGKLLCGQQELLLEAGRREQTWDLTATAPLELGDGLVLRSLSVLPAVPHLEHASWRILKHPRISAERQTKWTFGDRTIRGVGGPGCVELQDQAFGDFILQAVVTAHGKLTNGGIFFRAIPDDFMNGYEAQVFNGCLEGDPNRPSKWSTGAIDDRENARRVVSRDGVPFYYTIIAQGPHIAVWINGYQQVDWTDDRAEDDNPRKGRRTKLGAIQLQAHDAETDIEFADIRILSLQAK